MTRTSATERRTSLVRVLLLAGVVAGLFAMHGLGDHGTTHPGGYSGAHSDAHGFTTAQSAPVPADDHARHTEQVVAAGGPATTTSVGPQAQRSVERAVGSEGGSGSGGMGLCAAVLAGVLFALAGLRAWGRLSAVAALRLASALRLAVTAHERDPPRLVQLSICRC